MRKAQQQLTRRQISKTLSVSAPVLGINARDPLAEMQPADAISLDNFFCTPYDVVLRQGYSQYATGISGTVRSIFSYSPPSGTLKMFAAAGSNIYNTTLPGVVGAPVVTGLGSDKWQYTNFGTAGGNFLVACNGVDSVLEYDGTTWRSITDVSTPAITGVVTSNLINVTAFKFRLWFTENNSLKVWYLPTLSIGGAAQSFDFTSLFKRGGYLVGMGDWSLDAGYGIDDYAVFVTSEGQVAVYKGTDPASAATWTLIGVFDVGSPIGRRCLAKYAGDLTLLSQDGLAPLSKALMSSRVNSKENISDRIQHLLSDYTTQYSANYGWQTVLFPQQNQILVNVPVSASTSYQLVMNTISGAWSQFKGWNTQVFELHGDLLFFGTTGAVCKAWDTNADNGSNINFEAQQSFNYFGNAAQLKQVKLIRPIISTDGNPAILLGVNTDFDTATPSNIPTFTPTTTATWDTALWDQGIWGGSLLVKKDWQTTFGIGFAIAAHMKGASANYQLRWASTDYLVDAGGVI